MSLEVSHGGILAPRIAPYHLRLTCQMHTDPDIQGGYRKVMVILQRTHTRYCHLRRNEHYYDFLWV